MLHIKTLPSADVSTLGPRTQHGQWNAYVNNGGTAVAVAGKDFCVIAGDTRLSDGGYGIQCRYVPKVYQLTNTCVLASSGMQADISTLRKVLDIKTTQYKFNHNKDMSCPAMSQLLSNTLYYKRFFPYYSFNVLGGIDENGEGVVYGYDAIGSFERMKYCVEGSASSLITSILDNQVAFKTQLKNKVDLTLQETIDLVKDVMTVAGERDIYTGDSCDIFIVTKEGVRSERFELKKD